MDADEYRRMAELQDSHWWFVAKRRMVTALLERYHVDPGDAGHPASTGTAPAPRAGRRSRASVLEVGCGTGAMLPVMRRWGTPVGADAYLPALRHLHGLDRVGADVARLPFLPDTFDLVGCFDLLYHKAVPDVLAALHELHRVCAPGGTLVITDSAFPFLRSAHDVATHGARRFRLPEMQRMLDDAGFEVVHGTYFHKVLFPVAMVVRLTKRLIWGAPPLEPAGGPRRKPPEETAAARDDPAADPADVPPRSDLTPCPAWLNGLLGLVYRVETAAAVRLSQPFGLSLAVVARKR